MGGEAEAGIDRLAGRVDRAAQHDEGVREIVAAKLARIEGDLDRGEGRRRRERRAAAARAASRGRSALSCGSAGAAAPGAGRGRAAALGRRAIALWRRRRISADRFERAENHKGDGDRSAPPTTIRYATGISSDWSLAGPDRGLVRRDQVADEAAAARLKSPRARPICCALPRLDRPSKSHARQSPAQSRLQDAAPRRQGAGRGARLCDRRHSRPARSARRPARRDRGRRPRPRRRRRAPTISSSAT